MSFAPNYPTPIDDAVAATSALRGFMQRWESSGTREDQSTHPPTFQSAWEINQDLRHGNVPPQWRRDLFERVEAMALAFQATLETLNSENEELLREARWLAQKVREDSRALRFVDAVSKHILALHEGLLRPAQPSLDPHIYGGAFAAVNDANMRAQGYLLSPEWEAAEASFWSASRLQIKLQDGTRVDVAEVFRDLAPAPLMAAACEGLHSALLASMSDPSYVRLGHLETSKPIATLLRALEDIKKELPEGQAMLAELRDMSLAPATGR